MSVSDPSGSAHLSRLATARFRDESSWIMWASPFLMRQPLLSIWRPCMFPTSRVLKKSTSGVLAALRGSTYRSVRLASSLAAALLDSLFEHPAWCAPVVQDVQTSKIWRATETFRSLLEELQDTSSDHSLSSHEVF
jgi:hypothetical protein